VEASFFKFIEKIQLFCVLYYIVAKNNHCHLLKAYILPQIHISKILHYLICSSETLPQVSRWQKWKAGKIILQGRCSHPILHRRTQAENFFLAGIRIENCWTLVLSITPDISLPTFLCLCKSRLFFLNYDLWS
jgi:hypothetical protein